jgi:hypothetical protein
LTHLQLVDGAHLLQQTPDLLVLRVAAITRAGDGEVRGRTLTLGLNRRRGLGLSWSLLTLLRRVLALVSVLTGLTVWAVAKVAVLAGASSLLLISALAATALATFRTTASTVGCIGTVSAESSSLVSGFESSPSPS